MQIQIVGPLAPGKSWLKVVPFIANIAPGATLYPLSIPTPIYHIFRVTIEWRVRTTICKPSPPFSSPHVPLIDFPPLFVEATIVPGADSDS